MKKGFIQIPLLIGIIAVALISAVIVGDVVINNKKQAEQPKQEQIVFASPSPSPEISSSPGFALTQSSSPKPVNLNNPIPSRAPTSTSIPTPLSIPTPSPSSTSIPTPIPTPTPSPYSIPILKKPNCNLVGQQVGSSGKITWTSSGADSGELFYQHGNNAGVPFENHFWDVEKPYVINGQNQGNTVSSGWFEGISIPITIHGIFYNSAGSTDCYVTINKQTIPSTPVVSEYSAYNLASYSTSALNDRLSRLGFIYGYTPIFNISVQDSSTESYTWTNLQYSISSSDFQLSDINLICGDVINGVFYLNSNGDFPNGSQNEITSNSLISPYAFLSGCNARRIGFALKNIHPGSLTITVSSAKFVGQSGIPYNATGLPITSTDIVIQ